MSKRRKSSVGKVLGDVLDKLLELFFLFVFLPGCVALLFFVESPFLGVLGLGVWLWLLSYTRFNPFNKLYTIQFDPDVSDEVLVKFMGRSFHVQLKRGRDSNFLFVKDQDKLTCITADDGLGISRRLRFRLVAVVSHYLRKRNLLSSSASLSIE